MNVPFVPPRACPQFSGDVWLSKGGEHRRERVQNAAEQGQDAAGGEPVAGAGGHPADQFPDTGEQVARFKGFIEALEHSRQFRGVGLRIRKEDITEVDSHDHVLLQCLDVVLGAMCFRLNDKHLARPPRARRRGSRTIAKEKLYKLIQKRIQAMKPHFNIGITTGGDAHSRWDLPYRHWKFTPAEFEYDKGKTKGGLRKK